MRLSTHFLEAYQLVSYSIEEKVRSEIFFVILSEKVHILHVDGKGESKYTIH